MNEEVLRLEMLRQNARYRAWRAFGVPVGGGVDLDEDDWFNLAICCDHPDCQSPAGSRLVTGVVVLSGPRIRSMASVRRQFRSKERAAARRCEHLAPLLRKDPPEVRAIAALELISGE